MSRLTLEEEVDYIKNEIFALQLDCAIRVEGKDDETVGNQSDKGFWETILNTVQPNLKYKIYKESNYTTGTGKMAVLEFRDYAASDFILVVDSDYDYIIGDEIVDNNSFILQTYAYSFENYICNPIRLKSICCQGAGIDEVDFDFDAFLRDFSQVVYPLFLISINEELKNPNLPIFTRSNFGELMKFERLDKPSVESIFNYLENLKLQVDQIISQFPIGDDEVKNIQTLLSKMSLDIQETYWLIRGKDIYNLIERVISILVYINVEKTISEIKERTIPINLGKAINDYKNRRELWKDILTTGFDFKNSPFFSKIQTDIQNIFTHNVNT